MYCSNMLSKAQAVAVYELNMHAKVMRSADTQMHNKCNAAT